jgi:hydroxyacylglutathione hydrolase
MEGGRIEILNTPGHTKDSVCFHIDNRILISGDTLFNGTIGNCFTGDLRSFFQSIKKLMALPTGTLVYAGHDYTKDAMLFAGNIEPDNEKNIESFLGRYNPDHVFSTLEDEYRVNPYFRFNNIGIINLLKERKLPLGTEWERWQSLMSIE